MPSANTARYFVGRIERERALESMRLPRAVGTNKERARSSPASHFVMKLEENRFSESALLLGRRTSRPTNATSSFAFPKIRVFEGRCLQTDR